MLSIQIISLLIAGSAIYFIYNKIASNIKTASKGLGKRPQKQSAYKKNGITYYS